MEMSRLTRNGTAEPVLRDKFSGADGDREILIFPVQLTTSRIGNLIRLSILVLCCMTIYFRPCKSPFDFHMWNNKLMLICIHPPLPKKKVMPICMAYEYILIIMAISVCTCTCIFLALKKCSICRSLPILIHKNSRKLMLVIQITFFAVCVSILLQYGIVQTVVPVSLFILTERVPLLFYLLIGFIWKYKVGLDGSRGHFIL